MLDKIQESMHSVFVRPPPPPFVPKCDLPILESYLSSPGQDYWLHFPKFYPDSPETQINYKNLPQLAEQARFGNRDIIDWLVEGFSQGFRIGASPSARVASEVKNSPSAALSGERTSDAIASWVAAGYVSGPYDSPPLEQFRTNPLLAVIKSTGDIRPVLDLSSPHGSSVNDTIISSLYPASMAPMEKFLAQLRSCGPGATLFKRDWKDAYKQCIVNKEDWHLQGFSWLGKYFYDITLVMGSGSSAGIYDVLAKTVLAIAICLSLFDPSLASQVIDDAFWVDFPDGFLGQKLAAAYDWVCYHLNIPLASPEKIEKHFNACTTGIILGIWFDTVNWVWSLPQDRKERLLADLQEIRTSPSCSLTQLRSVVGKLNSISSLFPGGRFLRRDILDSLSPFSSTAPGSTRVEISEEAREQFGLWQLLLPSMINLPIPRDRYTLSPDSIHCWPDASGGSLYNYSGAGIMGPPPNWSFLMWGSVINDGHKDEKGRYLGRKLTFLESLPVLSTLASMPDLIQGNAAIFHVDNAGSVACFQRGHSKDPLTQTVIRAVYLVAASLNAQIEVVKVPRCSDRGSVLADLVSKGNCSLFRQEAPEYSYQPRLVSQAIVDFIGNPKVDRYLGCKVLQDIQSRYPDLPYIRASHE